MKKQIIINASKDRSRIAIVEDGELVELYVENPDNVRTIGNVYLGRIQKVMPAIRAAFVDVGEKQDCFLHFSDLTDNLPQLIALAGEDVPGLDGPVLSLAPAKRIAEDDSEPDVEDALEVSPGDSGEVTEESRTKSRSGGRSRSRGRGRSRGGRGRGRGRREEEEEQEERRPLRGVIDLSSPSKPRRSPRPKPAPEPEEEPEEIDTPDPVDETPEAEAPEIAEEETVEEKPKSRRRSRAKAEPTPEPEAENDTEGEVETPEPDAEEKPKSRRRSRAATPAEGADEADRQPGAAEAATADTSDDDGDDESDDDEASGEDKPKRRRRRGRRGRGGSKSNEDGGDDADDDASKGKGRRRSRSATPADASDDASSDDAADDDADRTPKSRRTRDSGDGESRSRRGKGSDDADTADTKDSKPKGSKKGGSKKEGSKKEGSKKSDDKKGGDTGGRKRLPSTVDLSGSSRSNLRVIPEHHRDDDDDGDRTQAPEDTRSGETEDATDGRSRRRSRAESDDSGRDRGGRRSSKKTDDDSQGSDDSGSRRGGRRSKASDDGEGGDDRGGRSRRRSSEDSDGGDSDGRSRRRTRSGDDATAESESTSSGRSRGGRDSGRDSERSSRDGDRGGRSSSRDGGQDSGRDSERSSRDGDRGGRSSSRDGRRDSGRGGRDMNRQRSKASGRIPSNEELVKRDGKIIVKITKEAISSKGPRVSTDLSLAGRFLVLVPAADYVAVSKKIESAKERRRLRTLATSLKPDGFGVIVRTVAEGRDAKSLDTDLRLLTDKWRKIEAKLKGNPEPPVLLYQDVNMVSSVIRDLFSEDYDRILVDDPKVFANVQAYVKAVAPQMADKVELHKSRTPVYRSLGIEKQVEEAFSKRVNMRGGGYLFIETTEAMHVVDVNSGRAGRGKSQKQNLIDVNVEAAREVAKQLRLRDLGGIIVIDFIDLKYDRDRKKVTDVLLKAFEKDRAVTKLLPMSDFGLVQITRQRLRPSITANAIDEDGNPLDAADAVAAAGAGEIQRSGGQVYEADERDDRDDRSERTDRSERAERPERPVVAAEDATPRALAGRIRGWMDHYRATVDERYKSRPIVVRVHPLLGTFLRRGLVSPLTRWRLSLRGIVFEVEDDTSIDPLAFDVRDQKSGRSLLKKYAA